MSQLPYHVILVARLHRQPCLLVDRKEHVVVEDDGERDLARIIHVIKVGLRRRRDLDDNALPVLERKLRVDCVKVCMGPVNKAQVKRRELATTSAACTPKSKHPHIGSK